MPPKGTAAPLYFKLPSREKIMALLNRKVEETRELRMVLKLIDAREKRKRAREGTPVEGEE